MGLQQHADGLRRRVEAVCRRVLFGESDAAEGQPVEEAHLERAHHVRGVAGDVRFRRTRVPRIVAIERSVGREWREELPAAVAGAGMVAIEPDHMPPVVRAYVSELVETERLTSMSMFPASPRPSFRPSQNASSVPFLVTTMAGIR